MKRRSVLEGLTAASVTVLSQGLLSAVAAGQAANRSATAVNPAEFRTTEIKTKDNTVFIRVYGKGQAF